MVEQTNKKKVFGPFFPMSKSDILGFLRRDPRALENFFVYFHENGR